VDIDGSEATRRVADKAALATGCDEEAALLSIEAAAPLPAVKRQPHEDAVFDLAADEAAAADDASKSHGFSRAWHEAPRGWQIFPKGERRRLAALGSLFAGDATRSRLASLAPLDMVNRRAQTAVAAAAAAPAEPSRPSAALEDIDDATSAFFAAIDAELDALPTTRNKPASKRRLA